MTGSASTTAAKLREGRHLGNLEGVVLRCVAQTTHLSSDQLLELLPMPADEANVYLAVERLQLAGLVDAQPSSGLDSPRFGLISLTERGRAVVGR